MAPTSYDPNSEEEKPVPLPSAPLITLNNNAVLQPPLSRRGTGPGIVIYLPQPNQISLSTRAAQPLDPEPVTKWAEEGFAVVSITYSEEISVEDTLKQGLDALQGLEQVDIKEKFAVIVYEPKLVIPVSEAAAKDSRLVSFVGYGSFASSSCSIPILLHLTSNAGRPRHPPTEATIQHSYNTTSAFFVLPQAAKYDAESAATAHSRTLAFLRKSLGGPFFDIEAIWNEHCYYEFEVRSVTKTMSTMVAEPYVNHIPTMTGGIGRENLTAFYRDHFIFSNPVDSNLQVITRTIGAERLVDEFVYHMTHDSFVDCILPGVPPTGKKLSIPMMAVINFRGDRLYSEHLWWDQATVLRQLDILPTHLPFPEPTGSGPKKSLRLPVAGVESAHMLIDESAGKSNEMLGPGWGVSTTD